MLGSRRFGFAAGAIVHSRPSLGPPLSVWNSDLTRARDRNMAKNTELIRVMDGNTAENTDLIRATEGNRLR